MLGTRVMYYVLIHVTSIFFRSFVRCQGEERCHVDGPPSAGTSVSHHSHGSQSPERRRRRDVSGNAAAQVTVAERGQLGSRLSNKHRCNCSGRLSTHGHHPHEHTAPSNRYAGESLNTPQVFQNLNLYLLVYKPKTLWTL